MSRRIPLLVLLLLLPLSVLSARTDPFSYPLEAVVIDPGHGGRDPGARQDYAWGEVVEKEITLDIARRVEDLLSGSGLRLVMTRTDDRFVSLDERCRIAYTTPLEAKHSALFVSIHVNSAPSQASGWEILIRDSRRQSRMLSHETPAENIPLFASWTDAELNGLLDAACRKVGEEFLAVFGQSGLGTGRGVKEQDVQVLRQSRMPGVLVECGFLTNEAEARNLMDDGWRQKTAQAIARAVLAYARRLQKS